MPDYLERDLPCPNTKGCGSSDAAVLNADGSVFCFSCSNSWHSGMLEMIGYDTQTLPEKEHTEKTMVEVEIGGEHIALNQKGHLLFDRNISKAACEFFDVKVKDGSKLIQPYHDKDGNLVAQKIRTEKERRGYWKGDVKQSALFGQHKWKNTTQRKITIVEGELDALAFRDLMGDWPVVSIINGAAGASRDVKNNLQFFDNFREIYVCFDNDEQGAKAAEQVAKMFPIGKAKIVQLKHYKDANDYLKAGKVKEFERCWWDAKSYTPAGIVLGTQLLDRIKLKLKQRKENNKISYPFEKLNELTYGIRTGEMVTLVAGAGIGKSSLLAETISHILKTTTDAKVGVMMMEESVEMANLRLMSIQANKPLHLPDTEYTEEELESYAKETIELVDDEGDARVISFDHFGSNDVDTIISKVDYMAAIGAKYIFLDHISILVSDQSHGDERKALDEIATKLRTKVQERDICLFLVSHLRRPGGKPHEEGGETSLADIRGTAGIGQLSDIVLGFERNQQHDDEFVRNTTKVRVLKNRFSGLTGLTSFVFYDKTTGRLVEIEPEEFFEAENKGSGGFRVEDGQTTESVFDNSEFGQQEKLRSV